MSQATMTIDTQQIVHTLTAAGISHGHAGAIASVIAGTVERHHAFNVDTLCTKLDLENAVTRLHARIDAIEQLIYTLATKEDVANVRTEIVSAEKRIILWVVGGFVLAQLLPDFLQRLGVT